MCILYKIKKNILCSLLILCNIFFCLNIHCNAFAEKLSVTPYSRKNILYPYFGVMGNFFFVKSLISKATSPKWSLGFNMGVLTKFNNTISLSFGLEFKKKYEDRCFLYKLETLTCKPMSKYYAVKPYATMSFDFDQVKLNTNIAVLRDIEKSVLKFQFDPIDIDIKLNSVMTASFNFFSINIIPNKDKSLQIPHATIKLGIKDYKITNILSITTMLNVSYLYLHTAGEIGLVIGSKSFL